MVAETERGGGVVGVPRGDGGALGYGWEVISNWARELAGDGEARRCGCDIQLCIVMYGKALI